MRKIFLAILLILTLSNSLFAQVIVDGTISDNAISTYIGDENTCVDDYLAKERRKRSMLLIPATGTAAWGYALVQAGSFFGPLPAIFIGSIVAGAQYSSYLQFRTNSTVIIAAHMKSYDNKKLKRIFKRYSRKYPEDGLTIEEFSAQLVKVDSSGALCDSSLRKIGKFARKRH